MVVFSSSCETIGLEGYICLILKKKNGWEQISVPTPGDFVQCLISEQKPCDSVVLWGYRRWELCLWVGRHRVRHHLPCSQVDAVDIGRGGMGSKRRDYGK